MLHKDSITVDQFVNIHNEKIKKKISKKDLGKNLRQIIKMDDATLNLKDGPEIELTLPCVVGEIDFGNLIFNYNMLNNIIEVEQYIKNRNDYEELYDYFSLTCKSERWGSECCVAPHIDYGYICLGGFCSNLVSHFLICDYHGMVCTLKDFIKSMNSNSHYYFEALSTNVLMCDMCEDMIVPIVYKHTLPEEDLDKECVCKHCEDAKMRRLKRENQ